VERCAKIGLIDNVTRKPVPHPDWFVKKYSYLCGSESPPELLRQTMPDPPKDCFQWGTIVRFSNMDSNKTFLYQLVPEFDIYHFATRLFVVRPGSHSCFVILKLASDKKCKLYYVLYIVLCFCFLCLRLVYPMLPVSLDCPF
jgi:hypothetical protein